MALLFPWATKEYLLWEMSLGQILLYHNLAIEIKYGKPENNGVEGFAEKSPDEIRRIRDQYRTQYGDIDG
jgi:hypothetical protein